MTNDAYNRLGPQLHREMGNVKTGNAKRVSSWQPEQNKLNVKECVDSFHRRLAYLPTFIKQVALFGLHI